MVGFDGKCPPISSCVSTLGPQLVALFGKAGALLEEVSHQEQVLRLDIMFLLCVLSLLPGSAYQGEQPAACSGCCASVTLLE